MLKIWGNVDSINLQKVLWCCEELHLAHQRIDAGRHFGVVDTPALRKLNPHGLAPTIRVTRCARPSTHRKAARCVRGAGLGRACKPTDRRAVDRRAVARRPGVACGGLIDAP